MMKTKSIVFYLFFGLITFWGCEDNNSDPSTYANGNLTITGEFQGALDVLSVQEYTYFDGDGNETSSEIVGVMAFEDININESNYSFSLNDSTAFFSAKVDTSYAYYVTNQIGDSSYNVDNECNPSVFVDSLNLYFLGEDNFFIIGYDDLDSSKIVTIDGELSYDLSAFGCE